MSFHKIAPLKKNGKPLGPKPKGAPKGAPRGKAPQKPPAKRPVGHKA
ncbi:hypothetical protein OHT57_23525 [Streptomyces sp. NBC_00285]|nr:hypothetical protein [Streptomyces sp. NBC_00285]